MRPTFLRQVEHLLLNLTGVCDSSSGFDDSDSSSSFEEEEAVNVIAGAGISGLSRLSVVDSSHDFRRPVEDGGGGGDDDDGGEGGEAEGEEEEEALKISASSLSRLQLSRAIEKFSKDIRSTTEKSNLSISEHQRSTNQRQKIPQISEKGNQRRKIGLFGRIAEKKPEETRPMNSDPNPKSGRKDKKFPHASKKSKLENV